MARRGDGFYQRGGENGTWYLDFVHQGKRHQVRLGRNISRSVAVELARVQRGKILLGEAGVGKKAKDVAFKEAVKRFTQWAEANKRTNTIADYKRCLAVLERSFGDKTLGQIHSFAVERHKQARVQAGAKVRVNRELAALKALFNRCREWGLWEGENPVRSVKLLKEPKGRVRFLEQDEEARLLAASHEPLRSLLMLAINTGVRVRSEAMTLHWSGVDLARGTLTVEGAYAKNGQTRTIPLNAPARAVLQRLKEETRGELVFAKRDGSAYHSMRTAFELACERAGVGGVSFHVMRHTFASRLAMAGVDSRTIMELGGWSNLAMVQRYSHLTPRHKAEAVEKIAGSIPYVILYAPKEAEGQKRVST